MIVYVFSIFSRKCRLNFLNILNFANRIVRIDRIGQWVQALYNNWNVVSQNTLGNSIDT